MPSSGTKTRAEFKRLHRELGMTMVYATPDQLEALSMGERIAILREGKVVQTGTPDELYDNPVDSFVATMVGAPPMNLIPGKMSENHVGEAAIKLPFGDVDGKPLATCGIDPGSSRHSPARSPAG